MTNTTRSYGDKYEETKHLHMNEVRKLIRADIKKACPGVKVSVTGDYNSVNISVKGAPFSLLNPANVLWARENPNLVAAYHAPYEARDRHTQECKAMLETIDRIMGAYNYNGSDYQTDYFDVRFYGHPSICYKVENEEHARILAQGKAA